MKKNSFGTRFASLFARTFPTPKFLTPIAAGVDISDKSVKWIVLDRTSDEVRVLSYGAIDLPEGTVNHGVIENSNALAQTLIQAKARWGYVDCVHASLPEEAGYVFSMRVPKETSRDQVLLMIEFELDGRVPIAASAAVYDYDILSSREDGKNTEDDTEIGVVAFPLDLAHQYAEAFTAADIQILSLELEPSSAARAVLNEKDSETVTMLVDFGRTRTGISVIKQNVPIFTSTVEVGGDAITRTVMEQLHLSPNEAEIFKNEDGLTPKSKSRARGKEAVIGPASALADEVARHYNYWDTRRNEHGTRMTPVGRVLLIGGSSNLKGLPEYIASRIKAPTAYGNVWQHVFSFDDSIPPIDSRTSLEYATTIGLALRTQ